MATKETLFRPSRNESRASVTDTAAREIIQSELASRQAKIERLKAARLAKEAEDQALPAPPAKVARKK